MKNKRYMIYSIIGAIALWWVIALVVQNEIKAPTPYATIEAFYRIVTGDKFLIQIGYSIRRLLIGFGVSFILGMVLGILGGIINPVYYFLKPIILVMRATPTMAVILLSLLWLNREISPILVCSLVIFPIIYSAVIDGIRNIDKNLLEMTSIYHLGRKKMLLHVYIPSIRRSVAAVIVTAFSLNVKINIAAEVLSQPKYGIGSGFLMEKTALNTAGILGWAIVAILLAAFFEWLISKLFARYSGV